MLHFVHFEHQFETKLKRCTKCSNSVLAQQSTLGVSLSCCTSCTSSTSFETKQKGCTKCSNSVLAQQSTLGVSVSCCTSCTSSTAFETKQKGARSAVSQCWLSKPANHCTIRRRAAHIGKKRHITRHKCIACLSLSLSGWCGGAQHRHADAAHHPRLRTRDALVIFSCYFSIVILL